MFVVMMMMVVQQHAMVRRKRRDSTIGAFAGESRTLIWVAIGGWDHGGRA